MAQVREKIHKYWVVSVFISGILFSFVLAWYLKSGRSDIKESYAASGVTGLTVLNFATGNISQWSNDAGYLTAVSYSDIQNGADVYLDYRPNNVACNQDQSLVYDATTHRWVCGSSATGGAAKWGGIQGDMSDQSDLQSALAGKLGVTTSFGGDVIGMSSNLQIVSDSHNHTGATISGLSVRDFSSSNVSQWTNDAGYITRVNFSELVNATGVYFNYKPNNTACNDGEVLVYNASLGRWLCGVGGGGGGSANATWGTITGSIAAQNDLAIALSGKLNASASFSGDISGMYNNITVINDSHTHTGATISGLTTSNFASQNISQWNNNAGYMTDVDFSQISNGSGKYLNYKPNDVACQNGQVLQYNSLNARWECGNDQVGAVPIAGDGYILLRYEVPSGTEGGANVANTWSQLPLNTEVSDVGGFCTLTANRFVLPAGTYEIDASSNFYNTNATNIRLRNVTDSTTTLVGETMYAGAPGTALLTGKFTINSQKSFELQYIAERAQGTYGLGVSMGARNSNYGEVEVYRVVKLRKVQ